MSILPWQNYVLTEVNDTRNRAIKMLFKVKKKWYKSAIGRMIAFHYNFYVLFNFYYFFCITTINTLIYVQYGGAIAYFLCYIISYVTLFKSNIFLGTIISW